MVSGALQESRVSSCPGVSIIIPAYNYARFLGEAVDSALAQTYPEFEVLVIDDGSTDNTAEVAARYGNRIRYVYQTNAGLSAARNAGIRAARFSCLCFLDADDVMLPEMLAKSMDAFSKMGDECALVAGMGYFMDAASQPVPWKWGDRLQPVDGYEIKARDIVLKTCFMPSSVVARRAAFERCGMFDTTLRSSEDRDMWIRIGTHYRIYFLFEYLIRIRKHSNNMSRNASRMKSNTFRVICKSYVNGVASRVNLVFWMRVLGIFYFETALTHEDEGRRTEALGYLVLSLLLCPFPLRALHLFQPRFFRLRALARFIFVSFQFRMHPARS